MSRGGNGVAKGPVVGRSVLQPLLGGGAELPAGSLFHFGDAFNRIIVERPDALAAGPIIAVNTSSARSITPSVDVLADGSFIIAWQHANYPNGPVGIAVQRFSSAGERIGGELLIGVQNGFYFPPTIEALNGGGFMIVWQDGSQVLNFETHNGSVIFAGSAGYYESAGSPDDVAPEIIELGDGTLVTLGSSQNGAAYPGSGVRAQRVSPEDGSIGNPISVNKPYYDYPNAEGAQWNDMTALKGGGFVVTWHARDMASGGVSATLAAIFDNSGNKTVEDYALPIDVGGITATETGFLVVGTKRDAWPWQQLYAQAYSSSGQPAGEPFLIAVDTYVRSGSYFKLEHIELVTLGNGAIVACWEVMSQTTGLHSIMARAFSTSGEFLTDEITVVSGIRLRENPDVAAIGQNGFVVTWAQGYPNYEPSGNYDYNVHARVIGGITFNQLFTADSDTVDFRALDPGAYGGTNNDAGRGNDVVRLPDTWAAVEQWGLQGGFHGGEGDDVVTAGDVGIPVYGDAGMDLLNGGTGEDWLEGGDGNDVLLHFAGAGDDLAEDFLLGGGGSDAFLIGHSDTVYDAEEGEVVTLDGALAGDLFYITEADPNGKVTLRALQAVQGGFQVIGEASIRSDLSRVSFDFDRSDGNVTLTVRARASETPQDWQDTWNEKVDLLIEPAFESFSIAAGKIAVEYARDKAEELAVKVLVIMVASGAVLLGAPALLIGGAVILTQTEVGNIVLNLARVAIHEARGDYESNLERGEAVATAISDTLDKIVVRAKLDQASKPLLDAIATSIAATIASALDDGAAKFDARGLLHPDSEGAIIGTNVEDVILGTGEGTRLIGYGGDDILIGGSGADIADYGSAIRGVFLDLNARVATDLPPPPPLGAVDRVTLAAPGEHLIGRDALYEIHNVVGSALGDIIVGSSASDTLAGGGGDDRLTGGRGADNLEGGSGADSFVFQDGDSRLMALRSDGAKVRPDIIRDFLSGTDKIDLSAIDANRGTAANDAFTFIGAAFFTGQAGQLRYHSSGGVMRIEGDLDGDGGADFAIVALTPVLVASDFIL